MKPDLVVRSQRVVLPDGIRPAAIHIRDGVITSIEDYETAADAEVLDAGDLVVMPGIVDSHVHLNDPGRDHWEGFYTGTRAAAAGGVTTVVDMPLNSVPATTSLDGLEAKLRAAQGACSVDVGFWGGVVPGNAAELEPLLAAGVLGFKCFLVYSGVEEFPAVDEADLRRALPILARHAAVLLAHAEAPGPIADAKPVGSPRSYKTYLASRPPEAEIEAIELLINLCREYRAHTHIVHLATEHAIPMLQAARAEGLLITAETCPHYLFFDAANIVDGATQFKCAPPIRDAATREGLWRALSNGVLDLIATDHSPCPPDMKNADTGDFFTAWGGIASLQLGLSAVWTEAQRRGLTLSQVSRWMSAGPAKLAGLAGRKGEIIAGADADLLFFNPTQLFDWSRPLEHRHSVTPYRDVPLQGVVARTILGGKTIYQDGEFLGKPSGKIITSRLHRLNHASAADAEASFLRCCGSRRFAREMAVRRPFANLDAMLHSADEVSNVLDASDWLEAFAAHPRIGDRSGSKWSQQEQSRAAESGSGSRAELARLNDAYYEKFGFIFIVCATGKSSEEILAALRRRITNTYKEEMAQAAQEQRLITAIRLRKLIGQ